MDEFTAEFIHVLDDEDLINQLREHIQGERETIAQFITNCQRIVDLFKNPPLERRQIKIFSQNLRPECQEFLKSQSFLTVKELERHVMW